MKPLVIGIAVAMSQVLAACGSTGQDTAESPTAAVRSPVDGRDVYESVCADCHGKGLAGAPIAGDRLDWDGRSPLWIAVLSAHARDGYMQMPAQGENDDVYEAEIQAATEYMMLLSYPDRPRD